MKCESQRDLHVLKFAGFGLCFKWKSRLWCFQRELRVSVKFSKTWDNNCIKSYRKSHGVD